MSQGFIDTKELKRRLERLALGIKERTPSTEELARRLKKLGRLPTFDMVWGNPKPFNSDPQSSRLDQ